MQLDFQGSYDPKGGAVSFNTVGQSITFYQRAELVPFETEKQGRPVFRQADYVKVATPGEHDEIDREATSLDKARYRDQWKAYQEGRSDVPTGTSLTVLFASNPEIIEGLKFYKLHTVEQLAAMSDHAVQNLPLGGSEWREKAKRFMEVTADAGRFGRLEQRQRDLDFQVRKAEEDNAKLLARLADVETDQAKRAGATGGLHALQQAEENEALRARVAQLEATAQPPDATQADTTAAVKGDGAKPGHGQHQPGRPRG